jgi:hypothetical protein
LLLGEGHEVAPPDLEDAIDEAFKGLAVADGEVTLEDDAVEAGEHGDDQSGKLGDEARQRLYSVLRSVGAPANPIVTGGRRLCSSFLVAATPR